MSTQFIPNERQTCSPRSRCVRNTGSGDVLLKAYTTDTESYKIITGVLAVFIVLKAPPLRIRNVIDRQRRGCVCRLVTNFVDIRKWDGGLCWKKCTYVKSDHFSYTLLYFKVNEACCGKTEGKKSQSHHLQITLTFVGNCGRIYHDTNQKENMRRLQLYINRMS